MLAEMANADTTDKSKQQKCPPNTTTCQDSYGPIAKKGVRRYGSLGKQIYQANTVGVDYFASFFLLFCYCGYLCRMSKIACIMAGNI